MRAKAKALILLFFLIPPAYAQQSLDEALCGLKPKDAEKIIPASLTEIEKSMPPIHDQAETNWCYAFASCDLVNYNIHLADQKQNPSARYYASREVSVIDAISREHSFTESSKPERLRKKNTIDLGQIGNSMSVLQALHASGRVRTQAQIPFHSGEAADDGSAKIDEILRAQAKKNLADQKCKNPDLLNEGFYKMSRALAVQAAKDQGLQKQATLITNYDEISKTLPAGVLEIPQFTPHSIEFHRLEDYLAQIKKVLAAGQPLILGVCGNPLLKKKSECGEHEVTAVGAGYIDGVCSIRLRNSWGANWQDHGYVTLPVENLVNSFQQKKYPLTWVEPGQ